MLDVKVSLDLSCEAKSSEIHELKAQNASLLGRIECLLEDLQGLRAANAH
jgi:hypothetical protein